MYIPLLHSNINPNHPNQSPRTVLEPAGALSIAGLVKYVQETGCRGKTLVAVASGANMDFDRLRFVSERADYNECLISVQIPEQPGAFMSLYSSIFPRNMTEFSYRYVSDSQAAQVFMSFHPHSEEDREDVTSALHKKGFSVINLDENSLAKTHIRHMAGGRTTGVENERIFRFEFPERPGALREFLDGLFLHRDNATVKSPFNVTVFHYRAHGADVGRVLAGFQVDPQEEDRFQQFLKDLGFFHIDETANPAYKDFLL